MSDRQSVIRELLEAQLKTTVALNPFTGLPWQDRRDIASKTALQGPRLIPDSRLEFVDSGHLLILTRPQATSQKIREFVYG